MKKIALRAVTLCLTLVLLMSAAYAETATDVNYTVQEKMLKQLQAGSGFTGTLTVESKAVPGRESEALTTLKPLTFDCSYIYVRQDLAAKTPAESRFTLALVDGDQSLGTGELSLKEGALFLKSSLIGENWLSLQNSAQTADTQSDTAGALSQAVQGLLANTAMPGLETFMTSILGQLGNVDSTQWTTTLETYTTKIDLWIEGYRQKAVLGKTDAGVTTMQVDYQIPETAVKAQLKQMVMDMLSDQALLGLLSEILPEDDAQRFLNPELQSYYFYAVDQIPLNGDMFISRTVTLKGETQALTLSLPMYDSQGGAMTLRYDRHKGVGDLPEENTIALQSEKLLLEADYQTYSTLTGTTVYQGTLLRKPQGTETFEVGTQDTAVGEVLKTLSAAFTLSIQHTNATDAEGKDAQATNFELNVSPEYTPDVTDDDVAAPSDAQAAQYIVFTPMDIALDASFTSGQAKNASTALDLLLTVAGDQLPQTVSAEFHGKTKGKWTPEAFTVLAAKPVNTMSAADLQAMLTQAGVRGGLILLPYIGLPASQATATPVPAETAAP